MFQWKSILCEKYTWDKYDHGVIDRAVNAIKFNKSVFQKNPKFLIAYVHKAADRTSAAI